MARKLVRRLNFVCKPEEAEHWMLIAKSRKVSWSAFAREALNAYAGDLPDLPPKPVVEKAREWTTKQEKRTETTKVSNLVKLAQAASGPCENRLPKGAFCKRCGKIHS